jgi:curved DNA-binding protein CbpA
MTEFDPYSILGLGRSAKQAAIKTAYRERVRHSHPDRGGNSDDFIAIVKAFGLLSDPETRRLFDETGIVDIDGLRNHRRDVAVVLADMFDTAVQTAVSSGLELTGVNFITLMSTAVTKGVSEAQQQSKAIEAEIKALSALTKRIRRNDDNPNLFVERLNAQVQAKTEQHTAARRRLLILETAGIELGNYESDIELISALEVAP